MTTGGWLSPAIPFPPSNAFVPTSLSGLAIWLRSDRAVIRNGSNVSEWDDQSGNGNNLTQATNQLIYVSSGGGGNNPYLQSTPGGNASLDLSSFTLAQPVEGFIVWHQNVAHSHADYILDIASGGSQAAIINPASSSVVQFAAGDGSTSALTTGDHLLDIQWNGASSVIIVDGISGSNASHAQTFSQLHVGQAGGLSGFGANGNFYELALYSRILSSTERSLWRSYVQTRYGTP